MGITRAADLGRARAREAYYLIMGTIPRDQRDGYVSTLVQILESHKYQNRKKTEPPHPRKEPLGESYDPTNPEHKAREVIRSGDLCYNANTANNLLEGFLTELRRLAKHL